MTSEVLKLPGFLLLCWLFFTFSAQRHCKVRFLNLWWYLVLRKVAPIGRDTTFWRVVCVSLLPPAVRIYSIVATLVTLLTLSEHGWELHAINFSWVAPALFGFAGAILNYVGYVRLRNNNWPPVEDLFV